MTTIHPNANPHLITTPEDAGYIESVLLELRAVANTMNTAQLQRNRNLLDAWPGTTVRDDPGCEGVVTGVAWDTVWSCWVPFIQLDSSAVQFMPTIASIAAFILESGNDFTAALEEHVIAEVGDTFTIFDDESVLEWRGQENHYAMYRAGEWTITGAKAL